MEMTEVLVNDIEQETIDRDFLVRLFGSFDKLYRDDIKPYQRKELLFGLLSRIELSDETLKVGIPLEQPAITSPLNTNHISSSTLVRGANLISLITVGEIKNAMVSVADHGIF